ncbi:hypothetical protein LMG30237_ALEAABJJ_01635 [Fructobacillus tropaeoli]|uniref:YopX family protein n=1 Tax=Fructobacillus tropaeoli TaxID=709323 RepID=UPI002D821B8A|nr:hypothetical protein LMG30237_ALEAABJJ_01635 [Fructobacillus tropaeoli]
MREIKFREWDQNRHEIYGGDIPGMSYGNREDFDDMVGFRFAHTESIDYEGTEEFKNKRILEQYTGLHDKNGKEIYEGDIAEWDDFGNKRVGYVTFCPDIQFVTANHDYNFGDFAYQDTKEYLTIIGNVHENPELLEEQ